MKNVQFLNIPFNILAPNVTIDHFSKDRIANVNWQESFSQELLDFFEQHNLKIIHAESFFNKAGTLKTTIHIDSDSGDYTKINFIYGNGSSEMCWYRIKEGVIVMPVLTAINTRAIQLTDRQVTLIESRSLTQPALVQVGIPHNIVNLSEDRLCLSIVFVDKLTNRRPTIAESCKIFKSILASTPEIEILCDTISD